MFPHRGQHILGRAVFRQNNQTRVRVPEADFAEQLHILPARCFFACDNQLKRFSLRHSKGRLIRGHMLDCPDTRFQNRHQQIPQLCIGVNNKRVSNYKWFHEISANGRPNLIPDSRDPLLSISTVGHCARVFGDSRLPPPSWFDGWEFQPHVGTVSGGGAKSVTRSPANAQLGRGCYVRHCDVQSLLLRVIRRLQGIGAARNLRLGMRRRPVINHNFDASSTTA